METCLEQVRERLDREGVTYEVITHPQAVTAQEAAAANRISGYRFAKSVMTMINEQPHLFVLRASDRLDLDVLRGRLRPRTVRVAEERETYPIFPGAELGGIPAIPIREELPVYLDRRLKGASSIIFEAGSGTESIRMPMEAYTRVVHPTLLDFAEPPRRERTRPRSIGWRRAAVRSVPVVAGLSAMAIGPRLGKTRNASTIRGFALGVMAGSATTLFTESARRRALLRDRPARWLRRSARELVARSRYNGGRLRGLWYRLSGSRER